MDLASAKRDAATRSMDTKKKVYVNLMDNGEHELAGKAGKTPMLLFENGAEVALPSKTKTVEPEKPAKQQPAKKAAEPKKKIAASAKQPAKKKAAPKTKEKVMKKVAKKSDKKIVNRVAVPKGKETTMTAKQLRSKVLEGKHVFNSRGREIPCSLMAKNEPAKKINVVVNSKGYFITR